MNKCIQFVCLYVYRMHIHIVVRYKFELDLIWLFLAFYTWGNGALKKLGPWLTSVRCYEVFKKYDFNSENAKKELFDNPPMSPRGFEQYEWLN